MSVFTAYKDLVIKKGLGQISLDDYLRGLDALNLSTDELLELEAIFEDYRQELRMRKAGV